MIVENPITDLLAAPLGSDWTIEGLAEQLICTIAAYPKGEVHEFALDAETTVDRQTRRMLRPLLACLATKSAAEAGTPATLYAGHLSFKRSGPDGPVWVVGEFENMPGTVPRRVPTVSLTATGFRAKGRSASRRSGCQFLPRCSGERHAKTW